MVHHNYHGNMTCDVSNLINKIKENPEEEKYKGDNNLIIRRCGILC